MTKRDKFKGQLIGRVMARTGCTFEQAEVSYEEIFKRMFQPAVTIGGGMIARKVRGRVLRERYDRPELVS